MLCTVPKVSSKFWGIQKVFEKAETDQKYEETDLKFEETEQQNVIFKFLKKAETNQKFEETDQQIESF